MIQPGKAQLVNAKALFCGNIYAVQNTSYNSVTHITDTNKTESLWLNLWVSQLYENKLILEIQMGLKIKSTCFLI